MVKVDLFGIMEKYLMGNGDKGRKMALGYGNRQREILTKENGKTIDKQDPESLCIMVDLNTEENSKIF